MLLQAIHKKKIKEPSSVPGTIEYVGKNRKKPVSIQVTEYSASKSETNEYATAESCEKYTSSKNTTWIDITGIHDTSIVEKIGKMYDIHPLTLEDIVNTNQRPKIEEHDGYLYCVIKMTHYDESQKNITIEQVSLILKKNTVISFQETPDNVLKIVQDRIRKNKGRIRKKGSDYLAYSILDTIVDNYFSILEEIGDDIEETEQELLTNPQKRTIQDVYTIKRELNILRRSIWPLRDVTNTLQRGDYKNIRKENHIFLQDLYDHVLRVSEVIDTFREMSTGLIELQVSVTSNKMNEIMKILTIFSAIFIPLTFVVGIYGMNFHNMPEIAWEWGYTMVWAVNLSLVCVMLLYFKKKNWL